MSKKFIPLTDARVYYNEKTRSIEITGKSPTFKDGFKIFLNDPLDKQYGKLIEGLQQEGVVPFTRLASQFNPTDIERATPKGVVLLGRSEEELIYADFNKINHLFIGGSVGSGKTAVSRNVLEEFLLQGAEVEFYGPLYEHFEQGLEHYSSFSWVNSENVSTEDFLLSLIQKIESKNDTEKTYVFISDREAHTILTDVKHQEAFTVALALGPLKGVHIIAEGWSAPVTSLLPYFKGRALLGRSFHSKRSSILEEDSLAHVTHQNGFGYYKDFTAQKCDYLQLTLSRHDLARR